MRACTGDSGSPSSSRSSLVYCSYFLQGNLAEHFEAILQDLLSGRALKHYIFNQDISQWHFSAHDAIQTALSLPNDGASFVELP